MKTAAAVVMTLGTIIGGFLYADERWAHAAEFKQFAAQTILTRSPCRISPLIVSACASALRMA